MNEQQLKQIASHLPQKPGIHGKQRLFNSAVMITLIMIDGEYHFLFEKRAKGIPQEGEICFPGGKHETSSDKSCADTAIRETSEELGIKKDNIKIYGRMNTLVAAMGATIDPFIGVLENINIEDIKFQESEVEEIFTVPVSWFAKNKPEKYHILVELKSYETDKHGNKKILFPAQQLGIPKKYHESWGGFKHRILVFKTQREVIWGLTAEMIDAFIAVYLELPE